MSSLKLDLSSFIEDNKLSFSLFLLSIFIISLLIDKSENDINEMKKENDNSNREINELNEEIEKAKKDLKEFEGIEESQLLKTLEQLEEEIEKLKQTPI